MSAPAKARGSASAHLLRAAFIALQIAIAAPAAAAETGVLNGTVRDSLGNTLAGVEVLVLSPARAVTPVALTFTDDQGRFQVEELLPGHYRLAVLKNGYRTFIGRVNTSVQRTIPLVLQFASRSDDAVRTPDPERDSWILRVPRRGVLHEVEHAVAEEEPSLGGADFREAPTFQVEQLFSAGTGSTEGSTDGAEMSAMETRMAVATAIGDQGRVRIRGQRENLGSDRSGAAEAAASQHATSVQLDLTYQPTRADQVAFQAYLGRRGFALEDTRVATSAQQEQTSRRCDARWSKQVDPANRVTLAFDYADTDWESPGFDELPEREAQGELSGRSVGVRVSYVRTHARAHEVELGVRAHRMDWLDRGASVDPQPRSPDAPAGWGVDLEARERWTISGPLTLIAGLGYSHLPLEGISTVVVPSLGGNWHPAGGLRLGGTVSFHATGTAEPASRKLGYDAELAVPLYEGLELRGSAAYTPLALDHFGYGWNSMEASGHPLFVRDGGTAVHHNRLAVVETLGRIRGYVELAGGRAQGALVPIIPYGPTGRIPADRRMHYRNARVGVHLPGPGTDVALEYRWITAEAPAVARAGYAVEEAVAVKLSQQLSGISVPGDWRLIFALRVGSIESDRLNDWQARGGDDENLTALNRRLGAGVSVLF